MIIAKEIKEHFEIALQEIGKVTPRFDEEVNEWVFSHPSYLVEYGGDSVKEVVQNYPKYLREFIKQRLNDNLNPLTEQKTKGNGGRRLRERITLSVDIVFWLKTHPEAVEIARQIIQRNHPTL